MNPDERKEHINFAIMQNPVEITIQRNEKVRSGGGFEEVKSVAGPMMVRIFTGGAGDAVKSDTIGTKEISRVYRLLADESADIKAAPDVIDIFEAENYGTFKVTAVHPQIVRGVVCGYQVDIERVK